MWHRRNVAGENTQSHTRKGHEPIVMGDVNVHPSRNEVVVDGEVRHVKPKVMEVLSLLLDARGEVVNKSDLLDRIWPNMTVSESVLIEAIHELRRALADNARRPRFIQTIPRRGYRVIAELEFGEPPEIKPPTDPGKPRIAVTQFDSMSPDSEDAYFCEGLCEDLTNSLGKNSEIEVVARTSTLSFSASDTLPSDLAARLGATHLVGGTFRKHEGRVRVVAHLVDARSGTQLWSEVYDRELIDLLHLQEEIAHTIGDEVTPRLASQRPEQSSRKRLPSSEAFREFSKGRYFWKRDNLNPERALSHYETAKSIDPDYGAPYAGIVECLNTLAVFHIEPQSSVRETAIHNAERALFLEPDDPDSLFAFGYTQFYMHWDWHTARQAFHKCLSLNPNHSLAHAFSALLYAALRQENESRLHAETASRLDPFSPLIWFVNALHYRYFGNFEQSLVAAREGLEIRPEDVLLRCVEADCLVRLGADMDLHKRLLELESATLHYPMFHAITGLQLRHLEQNEDFVRIDQRLQTRFRETWSDPFVSSLLAIGRGDAETALDELEKAEQDHDAALWLINCDPYFGALEGQERLCQLRRRVGLPEVL